jgi:hypothetical protein
MPGMKGRWLIRAEQSLNWIVGVRSAKCRNSDTKKRRIAPALF